MLEMRPNCEHCDLDLPADSQDARICSFECTFCAGCNDQHFHGVCPNCGGQLLPRPSRAQKLWEKYPPSTKRVLKPKN